MQLILIASLSFAIEVQIENANLTIQNIKFTSGCHCQFQISERKKIQMCAELKLTMIQNLSLIGNLKQGFYSFVNTAAQSVIYQGQP